MGAAGATGATGAMGAMGAVGASVRRACCVRQPGCGERAAKRQRWRRDKGVDVTIGGIIASIRQLKTRKGDRMAVIMLEDPHGSVEVVIFPEAYGKCGVGARTRARWSS